MSLPLLISFSTSEENQMLSWPEHRISLNFNWKFSVCRYVFGLQTQCSCNTTCNVMNGIKSAWIMFWTISNLNLLFKFESWWCMVKTFLSQTLQVDMALNQYYSECSGVLGVQGNRRVPFAPADMYPDRVSMTWTSECKICLCWAPHFYYATSLPTKFFGFQLSGIADLTFHSCKLVN